MRSCARAPTSERGGGGGGVLRGGRERARSLSRLHERPVVPRAPQGPATRPRRATRRARGRARVLLVPERGTRKRDAERRAFARGGLSLGRNARATESARAPALLRALHLAPQRAVRRRRDRGAPSAGSRRAASARSRERREERGPPLHPRRRPGSRRAARTTRRARARPTPDERDDRPAADVVRGAVRARPESAAAARHDARPRAGRRRRARADSERREPRRGRDRDVRRVREEDGRRVDRAVRPRSRPPKCVAGRLRTRSRASAEHVHHIGRRTAHGCAACPFSPRSGVRST